VVRKRRASVPSAGKRNHEPVAAIEGHARVADFKRAHKVVRTNAGASLVDLGDGIGCLELHSLKKCHRRRCALHDLVGLEADSAAVRDFQGSCDHGRQRHFSVGANLMAAG